MSKAGAAGATKSPKPKLTPKAARAVKRLKHIEDGMAHVIATLPGYLREVREIREDIEGAAAGGAEKEDGK